MASEMEAHDLIDRDVVLEMLDAYQVSAAVGAAMELGLFWFLDRQPAMVEEIALHFELPVQRCAYWLQFLTVLGLIEQEHDLYTLSERAKHAIIDTYSRTTWALLAAEAREQLPPFQYFSTRLAYPGSLWEFSGSAPPNYIQQMREDPERARRFTHMLYELHQDLGQAIASRFEIRNVEWMMDLGGGSGVISMALLRANPQLHAVVVDIPNVCEAGREIALANAAESRLEFHPADFLEDPLPRGFDFVLECDVGIYDADLFERIRSSLKPEGRFVIIDQLALVQGAAPLARLSWALQGSLRDPEFVYPTVEEVVSALEASGFRILKSEPLSGLDRTASQFYNDMYWIEAQT